MGVKIAPSLCPPLPWQVSWYPHTRPSLVLTAHARPRLYGQMGSRENRATRREMKSVKKNAHTLHAGAFSVKQMRFRIFSLKKKKSHKTKYLQPVCCLGVVLRKYQNWLWLERKTFCRLLACKNWSFQSRKDEEMLFFKKDNLFF